MATKKKAVVKKAAPKKAAPVKKSAGRTMIPKNGGYGQAWEKGIGVECGIDESND